MKDRNIEAVFFVPSTVFFQGDVHFLQRKLKKKKES